MVRGLSVDYEGQKPGLPDYAVRLGEDGFPNLITASVDMEEVRFTEVNLGPFRAGDDPSVLPDFIRPEDIGSFAAWADIAATGEAILARCRENGRLTDCSLLSVTHYVPEHIWVFEYGRADEDPDTDGGSCFVAIDSRTGSVVASWAEE